MSWFFTVSSDFRSARDLQKTEGSVKVQLSGVFQKLRVNSRAKLIIALRG